MVHREITMTWNTVMRNIKGSDQQAPFLSPTQCCDECGVKLKPIFKGNPKVAETWFWTECDKCGEPVCDNCSDVDSTDDGWSTVRTCLTCLQSVDK